MTWSVSPIKVKLDRMFFEGKYLAPEPLDDLRTGIQLATLWINDLDRTPLPENAKYREHLRQWVVDANLLLGGAQNLGTSKLPPMNCNKCKFLNEYVGPEHLVNGVYTCRSCK